MELRIENPGVWMVVPTLGNHLRVLRLLEDVRADYLHTRLKICVVHNGDAQYYSRELESLSDMYLRSTLALGYVRAVNVGLCAIGLSQDVVLVNDDVGEYVPALRGLLDSPFDITSPLTRAHPSARAGDERLVYEGSGGSESVERWASADYVYFHLALIRSRVRQAIPLLNDRYHPGYYDDRAFCREAVARGFTVGLDRSHIIEHEVSASFTAQGWDVSWLMERNRAFFESDGG